MSQLTRYGFVVLMGAGILAALGTDLSARQRLFGRRRCDNCCAGAVASNQAPSAPIAVGTPTPPPPAAVENPSPSDQPLAAAEPKAEPEPLPADVTKIGKEDLLKKTPNFFFYDYQFEPEPGKRYWLRVSDTHFIERYPSGLETRFDILGRGRIETADGTVVARVVDGKHDGFQVFISDRTLEARSIYFRLPTVNEGKWVLLGEMKSVE